MPKSSEMDLIAAYVQKMFTDYNAAKVGDAFDYNFMSENRIDHFGRFTVEYVSNVLSAYKRHLIASGSITSNVDKERTYIPAERQLGNGNGKLPDDEVVELSRQMYESTKNVNYIMPRCYDILGIKLTEERKVEIKRLATAYLEDMYKGEEIPDYDKTLNRMCKKIAVGEYFK